MVTNFQSTIYVHPPGLPYGVGGAIFGIGEGLIYLDEVNCTGSETSLLDCRSLAPGQHNCDRSEDASAFCPSTLDRDVYYVLSLEGPSVLEHATL